MLCPICGCESLTTSVICSKHTVTCWKKSDGGDGYEIDFERMQFFEVRVTASPRVVINN